MAGNNGPWGGGGGQRPGNTPGGQRPQGPQGPRGPQGPGGPQGPELDELLKQGQERLRSIIGGKGGDGAGRGSGGGDGSNRMVLVIAAVAALVFWVANSLYTVQPEEQGVELFLGSYYRTTDDGLHFAPWPLVTTEVVETTSQRIEDIGVAGSTDASGLMLTTDENIVDIDFQVGWNIKDPAKFLFNLADPKETVRAVSESVMREIIAQNELAPVLNVLRADIAQTAEARIQSTLDAYESGINVVRVNLNGAEPPAAVIDAFREVQAAEQERDRLQREADAYANRVLAGARGDAAQMLEQSEAYRAQVVNEAKGEASRFTSVLGEYARAPEVTRKRLYLETMEDLLGSTDKVILEQGGGAVPYLPLDRLRNTNGGAN